MWPTILLASAIGVLFVGILIKMIRDRAKGKHSCSCGCGGCPMSASCHAAPDTADTTPSDEEKK